MDLPGTLIFDYPTVSAMSATLAAKLGPKDAEPPAEAPRRWESCSEASFSVLSNILLPYIRVVTSSCLKNVILRRPSLSMQLRGADSSAPAIEIHNTSSRQPCQRLPCMHLDAISCIPLDRWNMDAIPQSNFGGR